MKHWMCVTVVILAFGLGLLAGCGQPTGEQVKTVDVSGKVTLDGKPLEGVAVHFTSSVKHEGVGATGADGSYKLTTGAEPGDNKVYLTPAGTADGGEDDADTSAMENIDDQGAAPDEKKSLIPAKYSDASAPALSFTVPPEGSTEANFDLTSK